jgi:hypothetical protein
VQPDYVPFPKWWQILAACLGLAWLVYAIAMTVHAWPFLSGAQPQPYSAFGLFFYGFGIAGTFLGGVFVLVWTHASLVTAPHFRRMMLQGPSLPPAPPRPCPLSDRWGPT